MPLPTLRLPTNKTQLAIHISAHVERSRLHYQVRRTSWLLAYYYLQGYRRFDLYSPEKGIIRAMVLEEDGSFEHISAELLTLINTVAGRIMGMDLSPSAERQGTSLQSLRDRASAQVIFDALINNKALESVKRDAAYIFSCLGMVGIQGHTHDHPTVGLGADLEVIHPSQLYPYPILGSDMTRVQGFIRNSLFPLSRLIEIYGPSIKSHLDKMLYFESDPGDAWAQTDGLDQSIPTAGNVRTPLDVWRSSSDTNSGLPNADDRKDPSQMFVEVNQLWLNGEGGRVQEFCVTSGDYCFQHDDLRNREVYPSIGIGRFFDNGTFYGSGVFDVAFSQCRALEKLEKALYTNIADLDKYGILVLPQGQIHQDSLLKDIGRGLRAVFWDPDVSLEGFRPFPITPVNTGDMPGRVAQFAREGIQRVSPMRDLLAEKGRADSASALQFLQEESTRALSSPANGISTAFGQCYRSLLQRATSDLLLSERALPVHNLSLDLVGVRFSFEDGTVSFSTNPLPSVSRLSIGVREHTLRSPLARKIEALQLWEKGIETDPMSLRLFFVQEGLDVSLRLDAERGAFTAIVRTILSLYGDGETPGDPWLHPHTSAPEIYLRVLQDFMGGPALQIASPEVVESFVELRDALLSWMGLILPAAIPNPDDAALLMPPTPQGQGMPMGAPPMMTQQAPMLPQPV